MLYTKSELILRAYEITRSNLISDLYSVYRDLPMYTRLHTQSGYREDNYNESEFLIISDLDENSYVITNTSLTQALETLIREDQVFKDKFNEVLTELLLD